MKKTVIAIIIAAILSISALASDYTYVYDEADIFTYEEIDIISKEAKALYESKNVRLVIVSGYGIEETDSYVPGEDDAILLAFDMDPDIRERFLYQFSALEQYNISDAEAEEIYDYVGETLAYSDFFDAALAFLEIAAEKYSNDEEFVEGDYDGYVYYEYSEADSFELSDVVLPLLAGIVIGGISVLCVKSSYKKKVHGATYPLSQFSKLNLTASNDDFVNKTVVVTRIPDPPSSSGGGRSGGGSIGRSSGGGMRMGGRKF